MEITPMLGKAISAAKAGRKTEARHLLEAVLDADERSEQAWLWLSGVVDGDEERIICLENVLAINPTHQAARRGLAALRARAAALPPAPSFEPDASGGYRPAEAAPGGPQDVVSDLLSRIEQQQSQAAPGSGQPAVRPVPDNRALIAITIFLILLLICSVLGIIVFSIMPQ